MLNPATKTFITNGAHSFLNASEELLPLFVVALTATAVIVVIVVVVTAADVFY
jgi:hypothetical protein